jgi:hypothetical protein
MTMKKIEAVKFQFRWDLSLMVDPKDVGTLVQILTRATPCNQKYHKGEYIEVIATDHIKMEQGTFQLYSQEDYDEAEAALKSQSTEPT